MNYCALQGGMNQPLPIEAGQVKYNPQPSPPSSPSSPPTSINPKTPGVNFPTLNPQINITIVKETTLTVVYIPTDRPNQRTNVKQFVIVFVYPNGTKSDDIPSTSPSTSATTTTTTAPSAGAPSATTTTPSTGAIVPPSDKSPQVDLLPNFRVPAGTTIVIRIMLTTDGLNPTGVSRHFIEFDFHLNFTFDIFFTVAESVLLRQ